jgi:hypothetical protein
LLSLLLFLCSAAVARGNDVCVQECGYEDEPILDAAALVQPALLSGPNYTVDPKAAVGGYMARFSITTKFGPLTADSAQLLAIRVNEIPAIETLERASQTGAFAHAIAERGKKTGMTVVKVIAHPIDSIVGLPMGVARYFKKQLDTWTGRAQSLSDQSARRFENKGDPFRAPDGPMTAGRDVPRVAIAKPDANGAGADPADENSMDPGEDSAPDMEPSATDKPDPGAASTDEKTRKTWYGRAGSEVGREAKRYLKYNSERNEIAKYLGIDPNTSNPYVVERLNSLGWAAVWGNFSAGEALGQVTGTAASVIADSGLIDQFVLTHTPEQIRERNEKNLLSICSDEFGVRQFSRRGAFNDTLRTQFVNALVKLKPATGCNELLELGTATRGEVEARYLVNALSLILHHAPDASGGKLVVAGAALIYLTPNKKLLLPLPVDYLSWSHDFGEFFDRPEFAHADKTALIGGEGSMLAQRKLTERGWGLVLRAAFDGAPHYAQGEFSRTGE